MKTDRIDCPLVCRHKTFFDRILTLFEFVDNHALTLTTKHQPYQNIKAVA